MGLIPQHMQRYIVIHSLMVNHMKDEETFFLAKKDEDTLLETIPKRNIFKFTAAGTKGC